MKVGSFNHNVIPPKIPEFLSLDGRGEGEGDEFITLTLTLSHAGERGFLYFVVIAQAIMKDSCENRSEGKTIIPVRLRRRIQRWE
jgi:hypothetical protein